MLLTFTKPKFEGLIKENIKQHTIRADKIIVGRLAIQFSFGMETKKCTL